MFLFFFHKRILMEAIVWPTKNIQHDNLLLASRRNVSFAIIKRPLQPPESGNVKLPQSTVGLMNIKSFFLLKPSNSISWFQWLDFWFAFFVQKQRGNVKWQGNSQNILNLQHTSIFLCAYRSSPGPRMKVLFFFSFHLISAKETSVHQLAYSLTQVKSLMSAFPFILWINSIIKSC